MTLLNQLPHKPAPAGSRAVVFDVDNTLTPPRRPLEAEMARAMRSLNVPFFLSAGGDLRLVSEQFIEPLWRFGYRGSFDAFLCNGPTRYHCELFEELSVKLVRSFEMQTYLGKSRFERLLQVIETTLDRDEFRLPAPIRIIGERITDRVSMINVAPIGRPRERLTDKAYANRQAFKEHDDRTRFRRRFLASLIKELTDFAPEGLVITLGGETSFDIVINGNDKSFPLRSLLDEGFELLWYIGDALFSGGNDEAVLKFIKEWTGTGACPIRAIRVETWHDTIGVLNNIGVLDGIAD